MIYSLVLRLDEWIFMLFYDVLFYDELLYDELLYSLSGSCKTYNNRFHYTGINDEKQLNF